jgi:hypothetical protein
VLLVLGVGGGSAKRMKTKVREESEVESRRARSLAPPPRPPRPPPSHARPKVAARRPLHPHLGGGQAGRGGAARAGRAARRAGRRFARPLGRLAGRGFGCGFRLRLLLNALHLLRQELGVHVRLIEQVVQLGGLGGRQDGDARVGGGLCVWWWGRSRVVRRQVRAMGDRGRAPRRGMSRARPTAAATLFPTPPPVPGARPSLAARPAAAERLSTRWRLVFWGGAKPPTRPLASKTKKLVSRTWAAASRSRRRRSSSSTADSGATTRSISSSCCLCVVRMP